MSAWLKVRELILDKNLSAHERSSLKKNIANLLEVDVRTISNWVANDKNIEWPGRSADYSERLYEFLDLRDPYRRLADSVSDVLELKNSKANWDEYLGNYRSLRLGNDERFIEGVVEISSVASGSSYEHTHGSVQNIVGVGGVISEKEYMHRGPVFFTGSRVYFLGCGRSKGERYFRTMIFQGNDLPHENVIYGIVLTESANRLRPLASPVALVSTRHPSLKIEAEQEALFNQIEASLGGAVMSGPALRGILVD